MKGTTNIPVVNLIFRRDNKILFVLRKNTGWRDGFHALPSGHVEPSETFRQAGCREAMEEVGIELKPEQLEHGMTFQQLDERQDVRVGIYFEVSDWAGEPYNAEPDVHGEIAWFDKDNLPDTVIPTTRSKLQQIEAGVRYAEYGWQE